MAYHRIESNPYMYPIFASTLIIKKPNFWGYQKMTEGKPTG